jgi:hypothetical protein
VAISSRSIAPAAITSLLTLEFLLQVGRSPRVKVLDLKERVRCRGCGAKERRDEPSCRSSGGGRSHEPMHPLAFCAAICLRGAAISIRLGSQRWSSSRRPPSIGASGLLSLFGSIGAGLRICGGRSSD